MIDQFKTQMWIPSQDEIVKGKQLGCYGQWCRKQQEDQGGILWSDGIDEMIMDYTVGLFQWSDACRADWWGLWRPLETGWSVSRHITTRSERVVKVEI